MSVSPTALPDHAGHWLRLLSNHVTGSFAERLERHGVSVPQWNVLRVLYDERKLALKEIAERLDADPGALSRMVERLLAQGWVTREENRLDRRAVAISLTPAGRKLVPRLALEADENDRAFFGQLPPEELAGFLATVHRLLAIHPRSPKDSSIR